MKAQDVACFVGMCNSFMFDWCARQKVAGTHLSVFIFKQLPVLLPSTKLKAEIIGRCLELIYTSWDMRPFAVDCGYDGPPFIWDDERRFQIRCELDAEFFHLYGISRDDADYIMETFPIIKRKDTEKYGNFRTKDRILEIYDQMGTANAVTAVEQVFPVSAIDKETCAWLLALVEVAPNRGLDYYVTALTLATAPTLCEQLLSANDRRTFAAQVTVASLAMYANVSPTIPLSAARNWATSAPYVAMTPDMIQARPGTAYLKAKGTLPSIPSALIETVIKIADRVVANDNISTNWQQEFQRRRAAVA